MQIARRYGSFYGGVGGFFVVAGKPAMRGVCGTYDHLIAADPDLRMQTIKCFDADTEPHQLLNFVRIAGAAQQVAYDPDVCAVAAFGEAGYFSRALSPIGDSRHNFT